MTDEDKIALAMRHGMLRIDEETHVATLLSPPAVELLSDEDWIDILVVATELYAMLTQRGYTIQG